MQLVLKLTELIAGPVYNLS